MSVGEYKEWVEQAEASLLTDYDGKEIPFPTFKIIGYRDYYEKVITVESNVIRISRDISLAMKYIKLPAKFLKIKTINLVEDDREISVDDRKFESKIINYWEEDFGIYMSRETPYGTIFYRFMNSQGLYAVMFEGRAARWKADYSLVSGTERIMLDCTAFYYSEHQKILEEASILEEIERQLGRDVSHITAGYLGGK